MKSLLFIVGLLFVLLLSTCNRQSQVNGEIFIRTKGGETIPLSLVKVQFIEYNKSNRDRIFKGISISSGGTSESSQKIVGKWLFDALQVLPDRVIITSKTDSQGKFEVAVPKGKDYLVLASTERSIGRESEKLEWAVIYSKSQSDKLVLANDNLLQRVSDQNDVLPEIKE